MRALGEWLIGVGYWLALPMERGHVEQYGFRRTGGWILTFVVDTARLHGAQFRKARAHLKPHKRRRVS